MCSIGHYLAHKGSHAGLGIDILSGMDYDSMNLHAMILRGEVERERLVETEHVLAFHHPCPRAKTHVVLIAKGNFSSLQEFAMVAPVPTMLGFWRTLKGDDGALYHTYSTYGRGLDLLIGAYNFLDIAPKGRDEDALSYPMAWIKRHDQY